MLVKQDQPSPHPPTNSDPATAPPPLNSCPPSVLPDVIFSRKGPRVLKKGSKRPEAERVQEQKTAKRQLL